MTGWGAGPTTAAALLMVHTLTSLYEEGLIDRYSRFAVYPGHAPGTYNETLAGFVNFLAQHVQAYDRDLLVRAVEAPDTSKYRQSHGGPVPYSFQSNTVHLDPTQARNIRGKSVVVFDDFTPDGNGLDWARNLLVAAGAGRALLVTIGKFVRGGSPSQLIVTPRHAGTVRPYERAEYQDNVFDRMYAPFVEMEDRATILRKSFLAMKDSAPSARIRADHSPRPEPEPSRVRTLGGSPLAFSLPLMDELVARSDQRTVCPANRRES